MKLYILLAILNTGETYVIDHAMTKSDCLFAKETLAPVMADNVTLTCEVDHAPNV